MKPQTIIIGTMAVVLIGLFLLLQRQFEAIAVAQFEKAPVVKETGEESLLGFAVAAALDPKYYDLPAAHSPITMALVQRQPDTKDLDDISQIRAAFALASEMDHALILEKFISTANFGNGCIGSDAAFTGLSISGLGDTSEARSIAMAAALAANDNAANSDQSIGETMQKIASVLLKLEHISIDVSEHIQSLAPGSITVSGSCSS